MRFRFGDCEIDSGTVQLTRSGETVSLEPLSYRLLLFLIANRDRVVGKDELLNHIWAGKVVTEASLSNTIKLVRQAVGDTGQAQRVVSTVRGHGYRFIAQVEELPAGERSPPPAAFPAPAQSASDLPGKPSLALLGFENLGGHASADVFSRGLAIDLNARLGRLHGLFVIAQDSARQFSVRRMPLNEIGERLGARYLVFGTSQRLEARIRVTISLVEAARQQIVWSEQFDRVLDDMFSVQDEIVDAIVSALLPELERAEMERARLLPTENLDAWECYHRAMWHNYRFTAADSDQAQALLLRASRIDPAFSRAYAGLSFNHFLHAFLDTDSQAIEHVRLALDYARQSVSLDTRDAVSHWVLGRALFLSKQHDQALRALDRALLANPNYAQGHYARGFVEAHAGQADRAIPDLDKARRLSPFDPLLFAMKSSHAVSLALQGDPEIMNTEFELAQKANPLDRDVGAILDEMRREIVALQEALERTPRALEIRSRLAKRYMLLCQYARAAEHYEAFVQLQPNSAAAWNNLGWVRQEQGHYAAGSMHTLHQDLTDVGRLAGPGMKSNGRR